MAAELLRELDDTRRRTLALVDGLDHEALHRPLAPIMSPLVWDLGHIAAYEDLWCVHRLAGEPLLRPDLVTAYDAFETPRCARGEIRLLDAEEAWEYLAAVRGRTLAALDRHGPSDLHELVLRHELQHTETMRQAMFLGGVERGRPDALPVVPAEPAWVEVPAGPFTMGAAAGDGFAFDNERPCREVDVPAFRITRTPIANATFLRFVEGGGYERREWWSDEGWAWKEEYDITHPLGWEGGAPDPRQPVQHVSWFEAEAFARSRGARLPTEEEWEKASTWDQLDGVGAVWEWTASEFRGYPGFVAHPYREYSEVFFDRGYRVLRGGSWAAHPRVATRTFRNWDWPERRQIFSGLRLAASIDEEA